MTGSPLVSIVIVNWNNLRYLKDCIESILKQSYPNLEIIVVDNGSIDGSTEYLESNFKNIRLIKNSDNLGFPKAANQGINISNGNYVVIMNEDTIVNSDWLLKMVEFIESDNSVGMIAPKIMRYNNPKLIDSAGVGIYPDGMSRGRGRLETDYGQYNRIEEILLPSGCSALYRKKMLDEIGLFDESFFAYCEDTDLGLRGRLAGWKAVFVPSSVVYHIYSGSWGNVSISKAYYVERNHIWVVLKNFPPSMIFLMPFYSIWRFLVQIFALFKKSGSGAEFVKKYSYFKLFHILVKSYFDAIINLPEIMRKRKKVHALKKISNLEFKNLINKYKISVKDLVLK